MSVQEMNLVEHDRDFFLWTRQQADALRRLGETRPNVDIDWENVVEEIESLGKEQAHAIRSHLRVALVHLLALVYAKDEYPRRHWRGEIREQRARIESRIEDSPSLTKRLPEFLLAAYRRARGQASEKLDLAIAELPAACPFTLEQVLSEEWFPAGPSERNLG